MKYKLIARVVIFCFFSIVSFAMFAETGKNVLILHSYHQGYDWTDGIHKGIIENLDNFNEMDLYVEYLDSYRFRSDNHVVNLDLLFIEKYKESGLTFDAIIVTDDFALNYILHRRDLFHNAPVIFCGINDYKPENFQGLTNFTGLNEHISIKETLEVALKIRPNAKKVAVVSGSSITAKRNLELFMQTVNKYRFDRIIEFEYISEAEPDYLQSKLSHYSDQDVVIYLSYVQTPSGLFFTIEESVRLILDATDAAVFGFWDFLLPQGVVGGKVIHSYSQGETAALLTNRVLSGESVSNIPVIMESPNRFVFNAQELEKYEIYFTDLPDNSEIINRSPRRLLSDWDSFTKDTMFGYDMFENNSGIMMIIDPDSGIIIDANKAAINYYGYYNLIGMKICETTFCNIEVIRERFGLIKSGKMNYYETQHITASGDVRDVLVRSSLIDVQGNKLLFDIVTDITDEIAAIRYARQRNKILFFIALATLIIQGIFIAIIMRYSNKTKNAERNLSESLDKYKLAVNGSNDGIWDWNLKTNELYLSPKWKEQIGYTDEELPNCFESFANNIHPDDKDILFEKVDLYLKEKISKYSFEFRMHHKKGHYIWVLARGEALRDETGAPYRMAGSHTDITERKIMEEEILQAKKDAEIANEAKTRFLATMSHEIRTPLNAVIGMTDLALISDNDVEIKDKLIIIKDAGIHLVHLVSDILDYSKIESGMLELEQREFSLLQMIDSVENIFRLEEQKKNIDFKCNYDSNLPNIIIGDEFRIRQIVINLLSNAFKFTERGSIELNASGEILQDFSDMQKAVLTFSVSDTGCGIDSKQGAKIFQEFQQAEMSIARRYGGTGLGLSIVKNLVGLMDGTIRYTSTPGEGSVFTFEIKVLVNKQNTEKEEKYLQCVEKDAINTEGMNVLLADDDPINVLVQKSALEKHGFNVETVSDGTEVLGYLQNNMPDFILMDIEMPEMDGIEATKRIRSGECGESKKNITIIAITAHAIPEIRNRCKDVGMNGYITKPVDIIMLKEQIAQFLKNCNFN